MTDQLTQTKCFCNVVAMEKGIDPVGSAGNFEDAVLIEQAFPWKYSYADMTLPQEVLSLLDLWMERYKETGVYGHRPLLIAPDAEYSKDGFRRVIFFTKPDGLFAEFDKAEYLVPDEKAGALIRSWYEAPDNLPEFDSFKQSAHHRDILICTHGTIDVACAKFGYPLYKYLRDNVANDEVRLWRVSHFGGHLYAPTLMDMPEGNYWAYVDNEIGEQIISKTGDIQDLHGHYRGWAGVEMGFMQAMERACLMTVGHEWQTYAKQGEIIKKDTADNPQWAEVRINYRDAENQQGEYQARVHITETILSNHTSNNDGEYPYPQFSVKWLD